MNKGKIPKGQLPLFKSNPSISLRGIVKEVGHNPEIRRELNPKIKKELTPEMRIKIMDEINALKRRLHIVRARHDPSERDLVNELITKIILLESKL